MTSETVVRVRLETKTLILSFAGVGVRGYQFAWTPSDYEMQKILIGGAVVKYKYK
jgi:hypothetical protein